MGTDGPRCGEFEVRPDVSGSPPGNAEMRQRWTELAAEMAAMTRAETVPERGSGSLTVLGSGIEHGHLTIETEREVRAADRVFFSINDYVTKAWLMKIRPDAYDLSILYDESIERRLTYVRMSEALLHFVRRGAKVAAVFYGHPGIFAAPGHRALRIARREGHDARMRPGVSSLDCLIADLGFDPALHVVIWQVGVIGEFGYNRNGYANRGLGLLADELIATYGEDWEITHYVAAQYAGTDPRIDRIPIKALRVPEKTKLLNTLSTFYIPPKQMSDTDRNLLDRMRGGPAPRTEASGKVERTSLRSHPSPAQRTFTDIAFPEGYRLPTPGVVLDVLIRLSEDSELRDSFVRDPYAVLSRSEFEGLSVAEKRLLAMRSRAAVVAAMTGRVSDHGAEEPGAA